MHSIPNLTFVNGITMPQVGIGIMRTHDQAAIDTIVAAAADAGCRLFDTAALYGNEAEVSKAIKKTGLPRDEVFITTKLKTVDQGYENTLKAIDTSLEVMGLDYVDLYLIHWPAPGVGKYKDSWKAIEKAYKDGKMRAIGVCNFFDNHLQSLVELGGEIPMLDQVQTNPSYVNYDVLNYCKAHNIVMQAWAPLGGGYVNSIHEDPQIRAIGEKYGKTNAQVVLRWEVQKGLSVIPGSSNPERIRQMLNIFDFELTPEETAVIDAMNTGHAMTGRPPERIPYDPNVINNH